MSNMTNDEEARYGTPKKEQCAPLLSESETYAMVNKDVLSVRDFYEAKIASGELRVVKTIDDDMHEHMFDCCGIHIIGDMTDSIQFCPGCGARIVNE